MVKIYIFQDYDYGFLCARADFYQQPWQSERGTISFDIHIANMHAYSHPD